MVIQVLGWLILTILFIIFEMISLGLTTIWFAGGSFVAAIAAALGAPLWLQIVLFIAVAVALLFITRPLAVKHIDTNVEKTNVEALVGQTAVVINDIDNLKESGQIKLNGLEWTARTKESGITIKSGETVKIVEIQGVKAIVETLE